MNADRVPLWPGIALIAAAIINVSAEALVASAWDVRPYSYIDDYVNFLGSPFAGEFQGVTISSPLWFVMSAAWIVSGALIAAASIRLARGSYGWRKGLVIAFAALQAIGLLLFAVIPLGPATLAAGLLGAYLTGAFLSVVAGNALAVSAGLSSRALGISRPIGVAGLVLGAVGLASIPITYGWVPVGLAERISVYTYLAWAILTGIAVIRARRAAATA